MNVNKSVTPAQGRTGVEGNHDRRPEARDIDPLRWIALVAVTRFEGYDELAYLSLTDDHRGGPPAPWIA